MKAVVLEIKDGEAAVLKEDGTIVKVRRECAVGDTIELEEKTKVYKFSRTMRRLAIAAAAALVIMVGTGRYVYTTVEAAAYVTVDTDSSIEYVLNRRGQVISVNAYNEKGEKIKKKLEEKGLSRCTITEAMEKTKEAQQELEGEAEGSAAEFVVSVTSDDENSREKIAAEVEKWLEENKPDDSETPAKIFEGDSQDRDAAAREGKSTGRYLEEAEKPEEVPAAETAPEAEPQEESMPEQPDAQPQSEKPQPQEAPEDAQQMPEDVQQMPEGSLAPEMPQEMPGGAPGPEQAGQNDVPPEVPEGEMPPEPEG